MAQRYNFSAQTNLGNVAPGVLPTDVATVSQIGGGSTSLVADWTSLYNNGGAPVSISDTSPKSTVTTLYVNSNIVNGGQITFSSLVPGLVDGDTFVAFFNNNQNIAIGIYSTTNLTVSGVRFNKSGIVSQGYDNCTVWRGNIVGVEFIKEIFIDSTTVPTTPTGGAYNFSQNVLTPPAGWVSAPTTTTPAAGTRYVSYGLIMSTTPTITWTAPIAFGGSGSGGVISGTTVPTDATGADGQVYQLLNANGSVVALYTRASPPSPATNKWVLESNIRFSPNTSGSAVSFYPDGHDSKSTDRRHQ